MANKTKSRLLWRGQQEIEIHDGNGKHARLIAQELIEGVCRRCAQKFWVTGRIGELRCPYCGSTEVNYSWGSLQTAFIPEKGGQFFGPGETS